MIGLALVATLCLGLACKYTHLGYTDLRVRERPPWVILAWATPLLAVAALATVTVWHMWILALA